MHLSKHMPARTKTVRYRWCKKEFLPYDAMFRKAREGKAAMASCKWCGHKFENEEMMALACPEKGRNQVLCQTCADALLSSSA